MKGSRITNCFLMQRETEEDYMFSDGGGVCVRMDGYAVIPMEHFQWVEALAERAAAAETAALIERAKNTPA